MPESVHVFDKYLWEEKLPQMWCPGCGNGIVLQSIFRAVENAGIDHEKVVFVSGIGCSGRANGYLRTSGLMTNHGRAISFATGIKMQNPELTVIIVTGDGDCVSIGGNHFIHAARRNIDLNVMVFNNSNYGMTGGQYSPTTPYGAMTKTSVYGNIEPDFDICALAKAAGATYVARSTTYHVKQLVGYMEKAIRHKGFSVVETACDCPSLFGRLNKRGTPGQMVARWKDVAVPISKAEKMSPEELVGKVVIGEFVNTDDKIEYTEAYQRVIERAKGG